MPEVSLKPTHQPVRQYLASLQKQAPSEEERLFGIRTAFRQILERCCRELGYSWLVGMDDVQQHLAVLNRFRLPVGMVYVCDSESGLHRIVMDVLSRGEVQNTLFQSPEHAILVQDSRVVAQEDLREASGLHAIVVAFFRLTPPLAESWDDFVLAFAPKIQKATRHFATIMRVQRSQSPAFVLRYKQLIQICKEVLYAGFSYKDVDLLLVQHLLSAPLFNRLFGTERFAERNAVAQEMEEVLHLIPSFALQREKWNLELEAFYQAIVGTYRALSRKWGHGFLESVYRNFLSGRTDETPQPADTPDTLQAFVIRSTDELLQTYFGHTLSTPGVQVLNPFMRTGAYMVQLIRHLSPEVLEYKFREDLHGNERRLLPYYLAALNIEQEYQELAKEAAAFPGMCLVDTFGLGTNRQMALFNPENIERTQLQRSRPMHVILGTPPGVVKFEENARGHAALKGLLARIEQTYALPEEAAEGWVRALRWASDRLDDQGVMAFFMPVAFFHRSSYAALRRKLMEEFTAIYIFEIGDMGWEGDQEMCMAFFVMDRTKKEGTPAHLYYKGSPEHWDQGTTLRYLEELPHFRAVDWEEIRPSSPEVWPTKGIRPEYELFIPLVYEDVDECGIFRQRTMALSAKRRALISGLEASEVRTAVHDNRLPDSGYDGIRRYFPRPFAAAYCWIGAHATYDVLRAFPNVHSETANRALVISSGLEEPFTVWQTRKLIGTWGEGQYLLPFYVYDEVGTQEENITDEALTFFQIFYNDPDIHKWAIFHYAYAVLFHPEYRSHYAVNLQWDVPRIPFLPDFWGMVDLGKTLSGLHQFYKNIQPHRLNLSDSFEPIESVRRNRSGKTLMVNKNLRIEPIPDAAYQFKIGRHSAITWAVEAFNERISAPGYHDLAIEIQKTHFEEFLSTLGQIINMAVESLRLTDKLPPLELTSFTEFVQGG
ncbi:MAG TPA: hypothetical protein PLO56_11305 [Rhodothermales bacterium]|nr:hypothetical protein [Rhodothermales bacterium]